ISISEEVPEKSTKYPDESVYLFRNQQKLKALSISELKKDLTSWYTPAKPESFQYLKAYSISISEEVPEKSTKYPDESVYLFRNQQKLKALSISELKKDLTSWYIGWMDQYT
ncbi:unnamed protein product, partial [Ilex paraguariensis]